MRIAFFSLANIAHGGGYEKQIINYAEGLVKLGHEISIISLSRSATIKLGIFLSFLYLHPRFSFPEIQENSDFIKDKHFELAEVSSLKQLSNKLKDFDIVYAKNEILDSVILNLLKNKNYSIICGVHTVLRYGGSGKYEKLHNAIYLSSFYFKILKVYSAFHSINREDEKFLKSKIKNKKIFYIPNYVNIPSRVDSINKFFQILYVGRLTKQKGINYFLEIIKKLNGLSLSDSINFVICGSGPLEKKVSRLSEAYKNVDYRGYVPYFKMEDIYKKTDVVFIPSEGETFSLVCLEAQSFGALAVAFDNSGVRDIILNNKTGFLIDIGNITEAQKYIIKLIKLKQNKPNNFEKMRNYTRDSIKERFSSDIVLPKLEKMFKDVIANQL